MHILSLAMPDRFPRPPPTVQNLVRPPLQVGLQRALELRRPGEEVSVTVLVSPFGNQLAWHASVHLSSYTVAPLAAACVAVLGPGRDLPLAKYSAWARAREPLEQAKPAGATEIVLSNDGDGLLEGSVTNFFVVAMKNQSEMEVQTASLEDGVLPGVIRQLVIEVCQEDGIPLREVMPSWQARGTWVEAFVTNGLRMVQSVESIRARPRDSCLDEWTEFRLSASRRVTEHIRNRVLQRAVEEGTSIPDILRS
jgi:branched-subunit amino acid aminotransferase/4-amino-4-deoxychorismate lyase